MASREPRYDEFTVGWVCALSHELSACRLMLDEEYNLQGLKQPTDTNSYSFGRIGDHQIVAACLPEGESYNVELSGRRQRGAGLDNYA